MGGPAETLTARRRRQTEVSGGDVKVGAAGFWALVRPSPMVFWNMMRHQVVQPLVKRYKIYAPLLDGFGLVNLPCVIIHTLRVQYIRPP